MKNAIQKAGPTAAPVLLKNMTVPQLGSAVADCERAISEHDRASGLWGTLQGIALLVAKHRLKHGEFMPFVKGHMGTAHCQATRRMRLGQAFWDAAPKVCGRAHFEEVQALLGKDLGEVLTRIDGLKLNLKDPLVVAVGKYANGQSLTQLLLDLGDGRQNNTHHPRRELTAEQAHEVAVQKFRDESNEVFGAVARLGSDCRWKVLEDAELRVALDLLKNLADPIKKWLATPTADRRALKASKLLFEGKED